MIRIMARAQVKANDEVSMAYVRTGREASRLIQEGRLMTAAGFKWNRNVFLY